MFTCGCVNATEEDNAVDALITVGCNDGIVPNRTLEQWGEYYDNAASVSKLSEVWVGIAMRCSCVSLVVVCAISHADDIHSRSWPVPNEQKLSPKTVSASNTSFPILFVSNTIGTSNTLALFQHTHYVLQIL